MDKFEKQLTVDKQIVSLLSNSTYQRNFPYALREMVSNAYDADATLVDINISLESDEITIEDNGNGMSVEEFDFYLRIAGKKRGRSPLTTKFNRHRIGQFGIGFLAIFPFCETLTITSTSENSDTIFVAKIPAGMFFADSTKNQIVSDIKVTGYQYEDKNARNEHYTKISLQKLTHRVTNYFSDEAKPKLKSSYKKAMEKIDALRWELQEDLPIQYSEDSTLLGSNLYEDTYPMKVVLNGVQLFRNTINGSVLDTGEIVSGEIHGKYVMLTPWKPVMPAKMRNLKVRVNNVGIGERSDFGVSLTRNYSRQYWLTGEVYITQGVSLNINRDDLVSTPDYLNFKSEIAALVRKWYDFLEDVDVAAKTMEQQVRGSKQSTVASKKQVIEKNVKLLVDKGFSIEYIDRPISKTTNPVTVDKAKKTVRVVKNHPALLDTIQIGDSIYEVSYTKWGDKGSRSDLNLACRFGKNREIEINTNYPLFKSKRYGEVFKKIHIIALIGKTSCKTKEQMYDFIQQTLLDEFKNY